MFTAVAFNEDDAPRARRHLHRGDVNRAKRCSLVLEHWGSRIKWSLLRLFLMGFFAGPITALVHVWLSTAVTKKMQLTQKMTLGFGAYFETYLYLLGGGSNLKRQSKSK
jgi:hypothetical protein